MKTPSNRRRIVRAFFVYAVLIGFPITVLVIQSLSSLENRRRQIEDNVANRLQQIGDEFVDNLHGEWQNFLSYERLRSFDHYQPLILPEETTFAGERFAAVQRSPLYRYVEHLSHLDNEIRLSTGRQRAPSLAGIIDHSLVGYFQIDPQRDEVMTPYEDRSGAFAPNANMAPTIDIFQQFVAGEVRPYLYNLWQLRPDPSLNPNRLLQRMRAKRTTRMEVSIQNILNAEGLLGEALMETAAQALRVSYYEFLPLKITNRSDSDQELLMCVRPVVLGVNQRILIQGFVFNVSRLQTETQAYLELYQPEFGHLVVGDQDESSMYPLFYPFDDLWVSGKLEGRAHLQSYDAEKRRFWGTVVILLLALTASLGHLGHWIYASMQLDRKKGNFVSAITHELKAPLTSIIMYAEMLEEGWVKGKEAIYYRHIHSESERLSRLIQNILNFSGIERGVFQVNRSEWPLDQFVAETTEPLKLWIENNQLTLDVQIFAEPVVFADQDSLSQVIYNLCDNTIKYGRREEGSSVFRIIVDEEGTWATLHIYDNGPGVPKKETGKVFHRFYRIENEMTRESTGTGLGLALVKELVAGNGGRVEYAPPTDHTGFGVKIYLPKASSGS